MIENGITELEIYEAVVYKFHKKFWCSELYKICEVGKGCGRFCDKYKPRNGKGGICTHHDFFREPGRKIKLKLI